MLLISPLLLPSYVIDLFSLLPSYVIDLFSLLSSYVIDLFSLLPSYVIDLFSPSTLLISSPLLRLLISALLLLCY
jgi:hypothetical protein